MFLSAAAAPAVAETPPESAALQQDFSLDEPALVPGSGRQSVSAASQRLATSLWHLRIPAIGLDEDIRAGIDLSVLSQGPGHWVGTAQPGGAGNVVLAGHRTTYTAPFNQLDRLAPGDMMYFSTPSGVDAMYVVTETLIVDPTDIWITYETGESIATLFACHPKGSIRKRIVVRAHLVGGGRIA